jgi:hypothetical protein
MSNKEVGDLAGSKIKNSFQVGNKFQQKGQILVINYQAKTPHEKEELELYDDKECIRKVQKAIGEFLEPYGIDNKKDTYSGQYYGKKEDFIHFDGSTWDVAIKALEISFLKNPICEECYERSVYKSGYSSSKDSCLKCGSENITKNPQKIWDIINMYAPKK